MEVKSHYFCGRGSTTAVAVKNQVQLKKLRIAKFIQKWKKKILLPRPWYYHDHGSSVILLPSPWLYRGSTCRWFGGLSLSSSTLTNSFHYYHTIGGLLFLVVPVSYVAETVAQKCLKYLDEILQHVPDIAIFPIKRSNHYKIALSQFPKAPMGTKATPHSISVCNVRI